MSRREDIDSKIRDEAARIGVTVHYFNGFAQYTGKHPLDQLIAEQREKARNGGPGRRPPHRASHRSEAAAGPEHSPPYAEWE